MSSREEAYYESAFGSTDVLCPVRSRSSPNIHIGTCLGGKGRQRQQGLQGQKHSHGTCLGSGGAPVWGTFVSWSFFSAKPGQTHPPIVATLSRQSLPRTARFSCPNIRMAPVWAGCLGRPRQVQKQELPKHSHGNCLGSCFLKSQKHSHGTYLAPICLGSTPAFCQHLGHY